MSFSKSVWERRADDMGQRDSMGQGFFNFMLCFWTAAGIASSAVAAYVSLSWQSSWLLMIGVLVVAIAGIFIALGSDFPPISLLGYSMVTVPMGLLLGPFVNQFTGASVVSILMVTTAMVVGLGLIGAFIPKSLESWGGFLFGSLIVLLVGLLIVPIAGAFGLPVEQALTWMDWIGIVLFSGYVIYDLNRAQRVPFNHDNAIDCALAVYLDFANIFIRLLSQGGTSKD